MTPTSPADGTSPTHVHGALRPRARLVRTLGRDLISSETVALVELVKNSYDADATHVQISFAGDIARGAGSIKVRDDGHGIAPQALQHVWLDLATDVKQRNTRSESGRRRVQGEKGIGRLAASRLANKTTLHSRRVDGPEVRLTVDWSLFDREDSYLDEVDVDWSQGPPSLFTGEPQKPGQGWPPHGTLLILDGLTTSWGVEEITTLRTALSRLVGPAARADGDFVITLELPPPFQESSGEVTGPAELFRPHFRMSGTVDRFGEGRFVYQQLNPPLRTELQTHLWEPDAQPPTAGPFTLELEVWDRDRDSIATVTTASFRDFRALLDEVAGVSVYRDGFRVLPFGETGDDWLALDRRRIQNPSQRISNNQVIGRVEISADDNPALRDQSNREGLIESRAYDDLKTMVRAALSEVESRRRASRSRPQRPAKEERAGLFSAFNLDTVRNAVEHDTADRNQVLELLDRKDEELREGVRAVQQVLSQYSRLATLGSLIDRVLHDGRGVITRLQALARAGRREMTKPATAEAKLARVEADYAVLEVQTDLLRLLFNQIEPFSGRRRGKPKVQSMIEIVNDAVRIVEPDARERGIELHVRGEDQTVTVDPAEVLTVLVNLLQNAIYWTARSPVGERNVDVEVARAGDSSVRLTVSDSGPGVEPWATTSIFEPYFSTKPDGVGLGLSIAGNVLADLYDGDLVLLDSGPLPGATFAATLRRRV